MCLSPEGRAGGSLAWSACPGRVQGSRLNEGHVQMSEVNDSSDTAGQKPRVGVTETAMTVLDAGHQ